MGTRSLTRIFESEKGKEIICLYRQFDGYPEGMGKDIFDAFHEWQFCNGISGENACARCKKQDYEDIHQKPKAYQYHEFVPQKFSNGIHCFAATFVGKLKGDRIGNVYLYPPKTKDAGQEYEYHLWLAGGTKKHDVPTGPLMMKVIKPAYKGWGLKNEGAHPEIVLFCGPLTDFTPDKCKTQEEREEEAAEAAAEAKG